LRRLNFTWTSAGRKQVTYCSPGCYCHDNGTPQSYCYPANVPASYFVQCCLDLVKENRELSREARLFAWLGAAIALGAAAVICSGCPPRREVGKLPA